MQPILFRIPIGDGIPVFGFGMMLFLGFLAGLWVACRRARREGIAPEVVQDVALWLFLGGLLGARTTYLILHKQVKNIGQFFDQIWRIMDGGIVLYGAFIGAFVVYWIGWYCFFRKKENYSTLKVGDMIVLGLVLGVSIGRLGCLLNGCCYGAVACSGSCPAVSYPLSAPVRYELVRAGHQTPAGFLIDRNVPIVLGIEPGSAVSNSGLQVGDRIVAINGVTVTSTEEVNEELGKWPRGLSELILTVRPYEQRSFVLGLVAGSASHEALVDIEKELSPVRPTTLGVLPTQVFETISMALAFALLLAFYPFRRRPGQIAGLFFVCYGVHRFLNEILRSDTRPEGFENLTSIVLIGIGLSVVGWLAFAGKREPAPSA